jgi:hypothetical protein
MGLLMKREPLGVDELHHPRARQLRMQTSRAIRGQEEGQMTMRKFLIALAAVAFATPARAANTSDPPNRGHVNNTVERNSSLEYTCRSTNKNEIIATDKTNEISCEFIQILVTKEGKPGDLQKMIDKMMEEVRKGEPAKPEMNKAFEDMIAVLDGTKYDADLKAHIDKLSPQEKADQKRALVAMLNFYRKPDIANGMEFARIVHELEMRTCKVVSFQFTQVFRKVSPTTWTAVSDPNAGLLTRPCGIVNLSRFEAARYYGWDYYARKAITNPNGTALGDKCGETFDEREYKYESGSNDRVLMNCDYIKLSVL